MGAGIPDQQVLEQSTSFGQRQPAAIDAVAGEQIETHQMRGHGRGGRGETTPGGQSPRQRDNVEAPGVGCRI
jgi:hypothetical protein